MRIKTTINNGWKFSREKVIPENISECTGAWESVSLPHTWNAADGQDGGNDYYRGLCTYVKNITASELPKKECIFLEIGAAANEANVYLNGKHLGGHTGGFSIFRFELTEALKKDSDNLLVITVDNSENDYVYPQKADFTFYGGLYRGVSLIGTDREHFELIKDGTPGIKITPITDAKEHCCDVTIEAWCSGGDMVRLSAGDAVVEVTVDNGYAKGVLHMDDVRLWDGLNDAYLYEAKAELMADGVIKDSVSEKFGCRTFFADPQEGFMLNGRPYPLRGVSRHQDKLGKGNAITLDDMKEDIALIKELGANTLRLAHYQHAQEFYDLCDEAGIVVWAEVPVITAFMENAQDNATQQLRELITQSHHHASIACWGLSNEITAATNVDDTLLEAHRKLNDLAHRMDDTRMTVMAHAFMLEHESPLIPIADAASYNLYFGWYLGELEENERFLDEYHEKYPDRIIGFSEYGADANVAYHSDKPGKGDYSEEYQCVYHEHMLDMIEKRPYLWATHVWNLFDFGADGRDEGGKRGQNQKGLVEIDHRTKKDAFYLYKAAWSSEPFVHICGRRYMERIGDTVQVKVYSNQDKVRLFVDGKEAGTMTGRRVFTFDIPITGRHKVEATAADDSVRDEIIICKTDTPNESYKMPGSTEIVNWFDNEDFKEDCYSIRDTMGTLKANPKTASILARMMEKVTESRGDVAKSAMGNEALERMMANIPLEQLIQQAGEGAVSKEQVQQLNRTLQQIKKD